MISAGWAVVAFFIGSISSIGILVFFIGGSKNSKCDECEYKAKVNGKGSYYMSYGKQTGELMEMIDKTPPPPKHNWEITHADKPVRAMNRKNGRRNKI